MYVCVFFLCEMIYSYWVNQGPLLYHFADMGNEMSIELSLEEIKACLPAFGLELIEEEHGIECEYTTDPDTMHPTVYRTVFFVCRKTLPVTSQDQGSDKTQS